MSEPALSAQPLTAPATAENSQTGGGDIPESPPPCLATIGTVPDRDRIRVSLRGDLDLQGQRLLPDLSQALRRSGNGIDLDLTGVEFCDRAGFNVLLDLRRQALAQGKTVTLRASSPQVERLLDLTGARELFVHLDQEAADAADTHGSHQDTEQDLRTEVLHLRRAMQTRPTIDLARGILMATFHLSPETAWDVLVATSQNTNTKLRQLADDLVRTVHGDPLPKAVQEQLMTAVAKAESAPTVSDPPT
ncbi:ANTAR domain-containing protein [Streptomyces smyrnaeus]|uniref:ANTAR domain-containing protein n=1 Tax=Streptomyces TaxID=1883 RepID=UPI000C17E63C|nr:MULTISPECIES: ANTAR domain-containing protein [unclassified Streptomyces]MBQ0863790.1 ANTAR domain-containing protein [Streptomyces sp. RK75]MBQ1120151.1 ANTAR domain-containing protein [Streptomyces sp. B15]